MEFVPHVIDGQETESADGGTIRTAGLGDGWVVLPTVVENAPFGGVGDSGVGREGGTFSREFFTEPKAVVMQV